MEKKYRLEPIGLIVLAAMNTALQFFLIGLSYANFDTEQFGEYRAFLALVAFSGLFHLGYTDGLLIRWLRKNTDPSFVQLLVLLVIVSTTILAVCLLRGTHGGLVLAAVFIAVANVSNFLNATHVAAGVFRTQSLTSALLMLAQIGYLLLSADEAKLEILLVLTCVTQIVLIAIFYWTNKARASLSSVDASQVDLSEIASTISRGFPVLIVGIFVLATFNLDKLFFKIATPAKSFADYALASSVITIIIGVLAAPGNILLRKVALSNETSLPQTHNLVFNVLFLLGITTHLLACLAVEVWDKFLPIEGSKNGFVSVWSLIILPMLLLQLLAINTSRRLGDKCFTLILSMIGLAILLYILTYLSTHDDGMFYYPIAVSTVLTIFVGMCEVRWATMLAALRRTLRVRLIMLIGYLLLICFWLYRIV